MSRPESTSGRRPGDWTVLDTNSFNENLQEGGGFPLFLDNGQMVVDGCNSKREKVMHAIKIGFFTETKKSKMSHVMLFADAVTQLAGRRASSLTWRSLCSRKAAP